MTFKHARFVARTVLVRNGNVDEAVRVLNRYSNSLEKSFSCSTTVIGCRSTEELYKGQLRRLLIRGGIFIFIRQFLRNMISRERILGREGIFEQFRRTRTYEKPYQMRRRVNYEKCRAIYDEDMSRKIQFVLRKNRLDPFPGCI